MRSLEQGPAGRDGQSWGQDHGLLLNYRSAFEASSPAPRSDCVDRPLTKAYTQQIILKTLHQAFTQEIPFKKDIKFACENGLTIVQVAKENEGF